MTAAELREQILASVARNGGHLASSLGAVELAMALRKVFDPFRDRVVWDVGHQAYAWKILTGRAETFASLRRLDGLSGFQNPAESSADPAISGHAGVALSVAEGLAVARERRGTDESVVAVIGDSAMVNGTSFEALNNCLTTAAKVIVVLNDNDMSISRPTGSFAHFLGRLTAGVRYNRAKNLTKTTLARLHFDFLYRGIHALKSRVKSMFFGNVFFEQFGLHYMGPVDGHDLTALTAALTVAKEEKRSVLLHVVTRKGKGFAPAEADPTKWHGVGPFVCSPSKAASPTDAAAAKSWSEVFGETLCGLAAEDERIVALTAAMKDGTGLAAFAERFPARFFDAGIAEGHLTAFAAGLAAGGLRPVVAIYSTFFQRAIDQVMHDVAIAKLPVVFCVDRAGAVGADGVTHQGLYDIAMLRCLPNLTICQPKDAEDLRALLAEALQRNGPTVIRYPRGVAPVRVEGRSGRGCAKLAIWAAGDQLPKAVAVAEQVGAEVTFARYLKPFDAETLAKQRAAGMKIVSLENGSVAGGFGEAIGADLKFGWPDVFIPHGTVAELEKRYGFDVDSIVTAINRTI